jgi:hypothetical protein
MQSIATPAQSAEWLIQCVDKSTGFLRSFVVIGSREDAEWHFRDTERSADRRPDAWVPKFILPNVKAMRAGEKLQNDQTASSASHEPACYPL